MKQYTGTKTVKAEPMTYGEAHERGLIRENAYVEEYNDKRFRLIEATNKYSTYAPNHRDLKKMFPFLFV